MPCARHRGLPNRGRPVVRRWRAIANAWETWPCRAPFRPASTVSHKASSTAGAATLLPSTARRQAAHARHVAFLDYHTGLGPFGVGELISDHEAGESGHRRLVNWFGDGDVTSTSDGSSVSAPLTGTNNLAVARAADHASLTMATLEYGTSPLDEVLESLMADCWLHSHGNPDSDLGRAIKAEIRRCFYPDTGTWKKMVFDRATAVEKTMLAGLAAQQ